jgi:hypothetical protein
MADGLHGQLRGLRQSLVGFSQHDMGRADEQQHWQCMMTPVCKRWIYRGYPLSCHSCETSKHRLSEESVRLDDVTYHAWKEQNP